jgi:hypothetical protein
VKILVSILNVLTIIWAISFVIYIIDPNKVERTANKLIKQDVLLSRPILGDSLTRGQFLDKFIELEKTVRELAKRYDIEPDISENYMNISEHGFEPNLNFIRLMKNSFAENGQHSKAGQFYYYEKYIERKICLNYFKHFFSLFIKSEKPDVLDKKSFVLKNSVALLWKSIEKLLSYIFLTLQWLWWGFGEKPSRTIFMSFAIIVLGAFFISITHHFNDFRIWDPIYFSVVSFLTVGDYSFQPQGITRLIVSVLALLGILNLGLLIAGFANKSKY